MVEDWKLPQTWSFELWITILIGLISVVLALPSLFYAREVREGISGSLRSHWPRVVFSLLIASLLMSIAMHNMYLLLVALAASMALAIWRERDLGRARDSALQEVTRLKALAEERIAYPKDPRGRWETVTTIRYGHLEYEPFLHYEDQKPTGLGVDLLAWLLKRPTDKKKVEIAPYKIKRNWNNILDGLTEGHYDVVATPLFATFDRSKRVRFTAPLFFSNVGLYVHRETASHTMFKHLTVENLALVMRDASLRCLSIKGEISEKLAQKYSEVDLITPMESGVLLSSLFGEVADARDQRLVLFCESFFAHQQPEVISGDVVNVLLPNEILYPVCFAVRLGDYQLANLLNIRLLQLTRKDGVIDLLAQKLSKAQGKSVSLEEVKLHFVSEWPSDSEIPGGVHV
jgi:ABC-type amino acid transport substrate-binding protein